MHPRFSPMLDETLRAVARRYRLPESPPISSDGSPTETLAIAIEHARAALAGGGQPGSAVKHLFIEALADLIRKAMHAERGDSLFQAMVLQHRSASVRDYDLLSTYIDQDRRHIHASVNAVAHPAKRQRMLPGRQRAALAQLHAYASAASWTELTDFMQRLLLTPEIRDEPPLAHRLVRLLNSPALDRLRRHGALESTSHQVRQYKALRDKHGPRSGSPAAAANGLISQRRGAAVEELVAHTVQRLADLLNEKKETRAPYRVVTSLRTPATIPVDSKGAKSEWDVVLLQEAQAVDAAPVWDVCLLVETKASVDAAATDLPRLLRGLHLLGQAKNGSFYTFESRQGAVRLSGASLSALADNNDLSGRVLYCTNATAETIPRLLSAASRMQLLSTQASVAFASALAERSHADAQVLDPVWRQLLDSPYLAAVLNQYPTLRRARELMVHVDDLLAVINRSASDHEI